MNTNSQKMLSLLLKRIDSQQTTKDGEIGGLKLYLEMIPQNMKAQREMVQEVIVALENS